MIHKITQGAKKNNWAVDGGVKPLVGFVEETSNIYAAYAISSISFLEWLFKPVSIKIGEYSSFKEAKSAVLDNIISRVKFTTEFKKM